MLFSTECPFKMVEGRRNGDVIVVDGCNGSTAVGGGVRPRGKVADAPWIEIPFEFLDSVLLIE